MSPNRTLISGVLLASLLALSAGLMLPAQAGTIAGVGLSSAGVRVSVASFRSYPDGARIIPPREGLRVELWSDPPAGSLVHPGDRSRVSFRTNADCYVTLVATDTNGRIRLIHPGLFDDGWTEQGRTYSVPQGGDRYDLVFAGPPGIEYVYAVASLYPMRNHFPEWLVTGQVNDQSAYDYEGGPFVTGWITGDPFYEIRSFCGDLVSYPGEYDTYCTAYLFYHVGRQVSYPRYLCSDCHAGALVDPYGPPCPAVSLRIGQIRNAGWIDFRIHYDPCFRYQVWTGWRPRGWTGHRWDGPGGRWVWSSGDGRREMRQQFRDAFSREPGRKGDLRVPDNLPGHGQVSRPGPEPGSGRVEGRNRESFDLGGRSPQAETPNPWRRAMEDRLVRAVGGTRGEPDRKGNGRVPAGVDRQGRGERPKVDPPSPQSRPDPGKGEKSERKAESKPYHRAR